MLPRVSAPYGMKMYADLYGNILNLEIKSSLDNKVKQVWEGMLIELGKVNAPTMLLEDFNYFFNKAIYLYINKRYNIYDLNQLTTDDLRVLKSEEILDVKLAQEVGPLQALANYGAGQSKLFGATYEVTLPKDYLHMLNCICIYKVNRRYKCYNAGDYVQFAAKRLTADSWSVLVNDYYNRPLPQRPYYYIHNININLDIPTNPLLAGNSNGTDVLHEHDGSRTRTTTITYKYNDTEVYIKDGYAYSDSLYTTPVMSGEDKVTVDQCTKTVTEVYTAEGSSNFPRVIQLNNGDVIDAVEKEAGFRYGNTSNVRMEIRYGHDRSVFELDKVYVDYIKVPQEIRLTLEQVLTTEDISQIMEFPDYVCQEIINELVSLVMENIADPRLQTHPAVTQSIANPAQQLAQQPTRKG